MKYLDEQIEELEERIFEEKELLKDCEGEYLKTQKRVVRDLERQLEELLLPDVSNYGYANFE